MANKRGKSPFFTDEEFLAGVQEVHQEQEAVQEIEQQVQEDSVDKAESMDKKGATTIIFGATQGRKGLKVPRINMGFSPENHDWLRLRSRQRGMTITEFVNEILDRERMKE